MYSWANCYTLLRETPTARAALPFYFSREGNTVDSLSDVLGAVGVPAEPASSAGLPGAIQRGRQPQPRALRVAIS